MSLITLSLPAAYPWVLTVASVVPVLTFWQTSLVSRGRKSSGIKYPQVYATKEEEKANPEAIKYNCVQRAHQNTLESVPQFFTTLLIAGARYPRLAAVSGAIWLVGRVVFTLGYSTGKPNNRIAGSAISYLGFLTLIGASITTSVKLLQTTGYHF